MKIIFLSFLDPYDIKNWSGTLYHIFSRLCRDHEVVWMGGEIIPQTRIFHYHSFTAIENTFCPEKYATVYGSLLSERIWKMDSDLIVARDSFFVAHLKTDKPIVYIGDTTFDLFRSYLGVGNELSRLLDNTEKLMIHNVSKLIFSSEWAKQSAIKHYRADADKIEVVEFGANIKEIPQRPVANLLSTGICNLLFIGRYWDKKGGPKAYKAYLTLKKWGFDCKLTIIGCQPQDIDITDPDLRVIPIIDKSKEEEWIQFDKIFSDSHFFILPTEFDCYGIVFCEASAYGIPSLANNVGGVHQVIRDGKNGYLFPPEATPEEYAKTIKAVFDDKEQYLKLRGTSRKEFEERLNWDVWQEKVNKILEKTVMEYSVTNKTTTASDTQSDFYIPTYIINMKERIDRKLHIEQQFRGRPEFEPIFVEACIHEKGTIGLWQSMAKIVKMALDRKDDIIIICEDDHAFTAEYNKDYFLTNLLEADRQGVEILSGGIGGFGAAVPVSPNRYWVDWFWCTQFIVVFSSLFEKILNYDFKENDTADGVLSALSRHKMTIYPFLSVQKDFGYSDVTPGNNEKAGLITRHFANANFRLSQVHKVSHFYNYKK